MMRNFRILSFVIIIPSFIFDALGSFSSVVGFMGGSITNRYNHFLSILNIDWLPSVLTDNLFLIGFFISATLLFVSIYASEKKYKTFEVIILTLLIMISVWPWLSFTFNS